RRMQGRDDDIGARVGRLRLRSDFSCRRIEQDIRRTQRRREEQAQPSFNRHANMQRKTGFADKIQELKSQELRAIPMRIVSLLPSATEMIYRLELQDQLVGVTHECDYPPEARGKPVLIESRVDPHNLSAAQIDAAVRELVQKGESVYQFKTGALEAAKPDLIITQGLCDVCAIAGHAVVKAASKLRPEPQLLSLDPQDLTGILTDIRRVGEAAGAVDKAGEVVDALEERVGEVAGRTRELESNK